MGLFLTLVFVLMTWRWTEFGLILYLRAFVGDLEIDMMWIDSCPSCLR